MQSRCSPNAVQDEKTKDQDGQPLRLRHSESAPLSPLYGVSCVSRVSSLGRVSVSVSDPSLAVSVARRPPPAAFDLHPHHNTTQIGMDIGLWRLRQGPVRLQSNSSNGPLTTSSNLTSNLTSNLYQRFTNLIQSCANLAQPFPALSPSAASPLPSYFNGDINGDDARWRNRIRLIARLS
ncbi:hypothetical protein E4U40_000050 [Claviceps sp. LM458 group G5]|nr:hypothetical protein E4U40_000050 [Claviceps sp. LM458 group G5]